MAEAPSSLNSPSAAASTAEASSSSVPPSAAITSSSSSPSSASRSLLGPLTTVFTPPDSCSYYGGLGDSKTLIGFWQAQGCQTSNIVDTDTCWPSINPTFSEPPAPFEGLGFYSPGLVCPHGYYTACVSSYYPGPGAASSYISAPEFSFQYDLEPSETAVGCCPTGHTCTLYNSAPQTCVRLIQKTTFSIAFCGRDSYSTVYPVSLPHEVTYQDLDSNTFSSSLSSVALYAPLIQINFKDSDLSLTSSLPASNTNTRTTSSTISSSSATGTAAASSVPQDTGGLSTSGKIAVGVAVPLGVIALALAGAFTLFRYRKRRRAGPMAVPPEQQPLDAQKLGAYHDAGITVGTEVGR